MSKLKNIDIEFNNKELDKIYLEYFKQCDIMECKKGCSYIRVSSGDQLKYSPLSQVKLIFQYALKNNIYIPKEYVLFENGITGSLADKRSTFQAMMSMASKKPKPFDILLLYDFSRFARNKVESVIYKADLRKKLGIEVVSITQPLGGGVEAVLLESLYEAIDEMYIIKMAKETLRGKNEKAGRGEHQGNPPYGYIYDKNTKSLSIDEEKAKIVQFIFEEWANKEKSTLRSILMKLKEMNIKTTRGKIFVDRNLHIILRNPAYIGMTRFTLGGMKRNWNHPDTKIVQGIHQPIIEKELWDKAQKKLKIHDDTWFRYKKPAPKCEHWLRGIMKCSVCGGTLVKAKCKGRKAYFQCTGYTKGKCNKSHHIREEIAVPLILEQLKNTFTEKLDINIECVEEKTKVNDIEIIENQLITLDRKVERMKEAYLSEIDTIEEYKENMDTAKITKEKLNEQLKKAKSKKIETNVTEKIYKNCAEAYKIFNDDKVDKEYKSYIAHRLFEKIVYDKSNEKLIIRYKSRDF